MNKFINSFAVSVIGELEPNGCDYAYIGALNIKLHLVVTKLCEVQDRWINDKHVVTVKLPKNETTRNIAKIFIRHPLLPCVFLPEIPKMLMVYAKRCTTSLQKPIEHITKTKIYRHEYSDTVEHHVVFGNEKVADDEHHSEIIEFFMYNEDIDYNVLYLDKSILQKSGCDLLTFVKNTLYS